MTIHLPSLEITRKRRQKEELANSISHGIALLAILTGTPFLIMNAVRIGDLAFIIGTIIFSTTAILLYLSSTIYHALSFGRTKRLFRIIDHSVIFLLIAGTYTPFTLGVLRGTLGWILLGCIWLLAFIGVILKAFQRLHHPVLSTGLYLFMGWLIVIALYPMLNNVPIKGMLLLLAGGLSYTFGVIFFATDSYLKYGHLLWHLFVIGGTTFHYFAILWYAY
ncbi:PAQR family membrane homeostasis protein TrhA [Photobacterium ganghwense]|uniref:PAQR family membrane homeostasis protein TrhA n=1 Tax=Photobacterium ganghwense TaxID=320778 RepID=UPI001A8CF886|nr:hemolysin III family protein [Photobacterium ganghwense]QSV12888.1 hemolysin III family protein [Photobacterium ganghwense]